MDYFRVFLCVVMIIMTAAPKVSFADGDIYVDVIIDQARLIRLKRDTTQIIIGNPAIADVSAQDSRLLVITGKSYGTTNLIALDAEGREILSARLAVREGDARQVTLYRGTSRQSYHCAPDCQRTLSLGDDKAAFEQLAGTVSAKFGVVNAAIGAK
jgi:hypothetical protein